MAYVADRTRVVIARYRATAVGSMHCKADDTSLCEIFDVSAVYISCLNLNVVSWFLCFVNISCSFTASCFDEWRIIFSGTLLINGRKISKGK